MQLSDAFIYLVLPAADGDLVSRCREAAMSGVDVIELTQTERAGAGMVRDLVAACRDEEVLLVVRGSAETAAAGDADGVILDGAEASVGMARAVLGDDALVGVRTAAQDDALLALEIGADFVVYDGGRECPAVFSALKDYARVPLFAGGLAGLEDARQLVEAGVFRLAIDGACLASPGEQCSEVADYARLVGRCV